MAAGTLNDATYSIFCETLTLPPTRISLMPVGASVQYDFAVATLVSTKAPWAGVGQRVVVACVRAYGILNFHFVDACAVCEPVAKRLRAHDVLGAEHAVQSARCVGSSQLSCGFERDFPAYDYRVFDISIAPKTFPFAKWSGLLSPVPRCDAVAGFQAPVADVIQFSFSCPL